MLNFGITVGLGTGKNIIPSSSLM